MAEHPKDNLKVEIAPGADLTTLDPDSWDWTDISDYAYKPVRIEFGKQDETSNARPSKCTVDLDDSDGRFSPRNPLGAYYPGLRIGTPLRVTWGSGERYAGYVYEWPIRWGNSVSNARVSVTANGILRRLQNPRSSSQQSALRRAVPNAPDVVAYWSLEEGEDATLFSSPIPGVAPAYRDQDTTPGAVSGPGGSLPLPRFSAGSDTTGGLLGPVPEHTTTLSDGWRVDWLFRMDQQPASLDQIAMRIFVTGSPVRELRVTVGDDLRVLAFDANGSSLYNSGNTIHADFYGGWVRFALRVLNNGSNLRYQLTATRPNGSSPIALNGFSGNLVAGGTQSPGRVLSAGLQQSFPSWEGDRSIGHITVTNGTADPFANNADDGYAGETAGARLTRLCAEEGIPFSLIGNAADTMPMGPQGASPFLDLARECETADGGLLYEAGFGLAYRARVDMYNQDVALALDWCQVKGNPEPTDDDQRLVNEFTVTRQGGSSATFRNEESIAEHGVFTGSVTVNVADDSRLLDIAGWREHLGSVDEMRWPVIPLELAYEDTLIPGWLGFVIGSRITVDHELPQLTGVAIDQLVLGWTEEYTSHQWRVYLNCVPASPWDVFVLGEDKLDTDGSQTASSFNAGSGTSLSVAVTAGPLWTTDDAQFPLKIRVSGVVLNVTDITGGSSPQTFTVDATPVNGVVKTIPAGSPVRLARTPGLAL